MERTSQSIDAVQAIAASVAQIELAVRDVQPSVEVLGLLITDMATGLGELRAARRHNAYPEEIAVFPDAFDRGVTKLEKQMHDSITQLQFYDRLVQHLGHVQDYLSGVASQLAGGLGDAAGEEDVWEALRSRLHVRLISQAQRDLLDAILPPPDGGQLSSRLAREEHAALGTIELF